MNKRTNVTAFFLALFLVISLFNPAETYASGTKTFHAGAPITEILGIKEEKLYSWLVNHDDTDENDTKEMPAESKSYYLNTPYVGGDHREPHGDTKHAYGYIDTKGKEAMNCTGFVWHVLYKASGLSWVDARRKIPNVTSTYWNDLLDSKDVEYYEYKGEKAVAHALASGHLEKGDILALYGTEDEHVGFFWGDTSDENLFWHSLGNKNKIPKITWCGKLLKMRIFKAYAFTRHLARPYKESMLEYYRNRDTDRLIFVKYKSGADAVLSMYKKKAGKGSGRWEKILSAPAKVGAKGVGKVKEGDFKTPLGEYDIDLAFGIKDDPGTAGIDYVKVNKYDYWSDDKETYDTLQDIRKLPYNPGKEFMKSEHIVDYPVQYDYALHIAYNKGYKKGSALFVHALKDGQRDTAGCVAVDYKTDKQIVKNTTQNTKIVIYR